MRRAGKGLFPERRGDAAEAQEPPPAATALLWRCAWRLLGFGTVVAAVCCAFAQRPACARDLTFPDAVVLLHEHNETLKAADEELLRARAEQAAARGLFMPKVEASARFTRLDDPLALGLELDLNGIRQVILGLHPDVPAGAIPPFVKRADYVLQDESFWRANLSVSWPLYAGGRITAANRAARAQVASADELRRRTDGSLQTELVRRYFGVRLAQQAVVVRQQVLDGFERHVFEARRLGEEGVIAKVERLHAEVARADGARDLMKARRDLEVAQAALDGLLSGPEDVTPTSFLFLQTAVAPIDSFLLQAEQANTDLAYLAAQQDLAQQAFCAQRATWLPEIALFGVKELHTSELTALDPHWAVGVGARYTLFDGFSRWNRTQAARSTVRRVDYVAERARRDVGTLVRKRHADLLSARDQFLSLESTLALAEEYVRARTKAFGEGVATSVDLVDAQLTLARVRLARLLAAYDYDVALAELLEACGRSGRFEWYRASADVELQP